MMISTMKEFEPSAGIAGTGLIKAWDHSDYQTEFWRWGNDDTLLSYLKLRAAALNRIVFEMGSVQTANEVRYHMKLGSLSSSISFAVRNGEDIGFCIQRFIKIPLQDKDNTLPRTVKVVFTPLRGVVDQGRGIGTQLLRDGHEIHLSSKPDCYVGRTQDEIVFASLEKSELFDEILPIDGDFKDGSDPQQVIWRIALGSIYAINAPTDIRTGLAKGVYPEGETGGYVLDLSHPRITRIHERFNELGLVKSQGDALYYYASVKQVNGVEGLAT